MPSLNLLNAVIKVNSYKGLLSESLIVRTAKRALNQYNRGWLKPETADLAEAIAHNGAREFLERPLEGRKLDSDLTAKGIDWLNRVLFKANGERRDTKLSRNFGEREIRIVRNFSHFTFDGFYNDGYDLQPTWRVHSKRHGSFSYVCTIGPHNYNGFIEVMG